MKKILLVLIIVICNFQNASTQTTNKYFIKNIESNNAYPNLGVSFFDDDFVIFSTQINNNKVVSNSRRSRKNKNKKVTLSPQNLDYYFGTISEDGNIVNTQKLSSEINSEYDDKGLCFNQSQDVVFFSRESKIKDSDEKHYELFKAEVVSPGSWVRAKKLPFNYQDFSITFPCLSEDGKMLYFVSNKSGNDDIYKVKLLSEWGFGIPEKLSNKVNTRSDETSPFILNGTLYFSSKRNGGFGGFDIYSLDLNDEEAEAQILEEPINSSYDDFCFIKNQSGEGYFSSNRPEGKGAEDVYFFKTLEMDKSLTKTVTITKETITKSESAFDFQRRNSYDKHIETKKVKITYTNSKNIREGDEYSKCQMEFDKINNIYFDYSEARIRPDAALELDKVIRVLRLCPNVKLLASSHTDSRASYDYNLTLSQRRSASVVGYLLRNGHFKPDRIIATGYGEARLSNKCSDGVKCTEKQHQANRRTHFEIENY